MAAADAHSLDRLLDTVRALTPLIRAQADAAEQQRRLPQPVVTALAEAGLFRMYTPQTLGGLEVAPLTFYRVLEALARIDASTAWCVWIASGNPVYVGRCLADESAAAVFGRDPQVATAGVVAPYGRAVVQDGGYLVSGRWPYGQRLPAQLLALLLLYGLRPGPAAADRRWGPRSTGALRPDVPGHHCGHMGGERLSRDGQP